MLPRMHINMLVQGDQFYVYRGSTRTDYVIAKVDAESRRVFADTIKSSNGKKYVETEIFPFYEEVFAKDENLWFKRRGV